MKFLISVLACAALCAQTPEESKTPKPEKCFPLGSLFLGSPEHSQLMNQLLEKQTIQLDEMSETTTSATRTAEKKPLRQFCGVSDDLLHPFANLTGERPKNRMQLFTAGSFVGVTFIHFFGSLRKPQLKIERH